MDSRLYCSLPRLLALQHQAHRYRIQARQASKSVLSGRKQSNLRGRGLDFVELRQYVQGDDVRAMDWRVTNRTGKAHIRVTAEEKDRNVLLLIDQRSPMFFASQGSMKSVIAAEFSALCAWRTLSMGDRIGAVLLSDQQLQDYQPARSETAMLQWFRRLVGINQALSANSGAGSITLGNALQHVQRLARHDYLIIIASDFNDCDDAAVAVLKQLSQHNDVIAVQISDALEATPELAQPAVISDGVHQLALKQQDAALYQTYRSHYQQQQRQLQQGLQRLAIPLLALNTHEPVAQQLQSLLGTA